MVHQSTDQIRLGQTSLLTLLGLKCNYSRPSGRPLLLTLVDITIHAMTSLRLHLSDVSINQYRGNITSIKSMKTLYGVLDVLECFQSYYFHFLPCI